MISEFKAVLDMHKPALPQAGLLSSYLDDYKIKTVVSFEQKNQNDLALIRVYQTRIDGIMPIVYQATPQYISIADEGVVNVYTRKQDNATELIQSFKIPAKPHQLLLTDYLMTVVAFTKQEIHIYYYYRNLTGKYFKVKQVLQSRNDVAALISVHNGGVDNIYDDRENEIDVLVADGPAVHLLKIYSKVYYQKALYLSENIFYIYFFKLYGVTFSDVVPFKTTNNQEYTLVVVFYLQTMLYFFAFYPNGQLISLRKQLEINNSDSAKVCCSYFQKDQQCMLLVQQGCIFQFYKIIAKSANSIAEVSFAKIHYTTIMRDLNYIDIRFLTDQLLLCFASNAYLLVDPYRGENCIVDEQSYLHFPFHKKATQAISQLGRNAYEIVGYDSSIYLQRFELANLNERINILLQQRQLQLAIQLLIDECGRKHYSMTTTADVLMPAAEKMQKVKEDPNSLVCIIAKKYLDLALLIVEEAVSGRALVDESNPKPGDEDLRADYHAVYMFAVGLLCAAFGITDGVFQPTQTQQATPLTIELARCLMRILCTKQVPMQALTLQQLSQLSAQDISQLDIVYAFDFRSLKNYIILTQNKQYARAFPIIVLGLAMQGSKINADQQARQFFDPAAEYSIFTVLEYCIKNSNKMRDHLSAFAAIFKVLFKADLRDFVYVVGGSSFNIHDCNIPDDTTQKYFLTPYLSTVSFVTLLQDSGFLTRYKCVQYFSQAFLAYFVKNPQKLQIQYYNTTFTCLWFYVDSASALASHLLFVTSSFCDAAGLNCYIDLLRDFLFNKKSGIVLSGPHITAMLYLLFVCVAVLTRAREMYLVADIYKLGRQCFDDNEHTITRQQPFLSSLRPHQYAYMLKAVLQTSEMQYIRYLQPNIQECGLLQDLYIDTAFCLQTLPIYGILSQQVFEFFTGVDLNVYTYDNDSVNAFLGFISIFPTSYIAPQYMAELVRSYLREVGSSDKPATSDEAGTAYTNQRNSRDIVPGIVLLFNIVFCELQQDYIQAFRLILTSSVQVQVKGMLLCKYMLIFDKLQSNVQKKYFSQPQRQLDQSVLQKLESEKRELAQRQIAIVETFWLLLYNEREKYQILSNDLLEIIVKTYRQCPLDAYLLVRNNGVDNKFILYLLAILAIHSSVSFASSVDLDQDSYTRLQQVLFQSIGAKLKADVTNEEVLFYDKQTADAKSQIQRIKYNKQQYGQGIFGFLMEQLYNDQFLYLLDSQARIHQILLDDYTVLKFIDDKNTPSSLSFKLLYLLNSHERLQNMLLERFQELQESGDNAALLDYMHLISKYFTEKKNDYNAVRFQKLLNIAYHIRDQYTREEILQGLADLFSIYMSPPDCLKYFLDLFEQSTWGEAHYLIDKLIKRIDLTNSIRYELADIISFDVQTTSGYRINFLRKGVHCDLTCICGMNIDEASAELVHDEKVILQDNSVLLLRVKEESNASHFFACGHCCHQQCLDETKESLVMRAKCIEQVLVGGGDGNQCIHVPYRVIYCPKCK